MSKYAGSGWIANQKYGKAMSLLGIATADLLGDVFEGIYHLNERALAKVRWDDLHRVEVILNDSQRFSTVDHNVLTRIVVLAHDRAMRVTIRGVAPGYLRLVFHQRTREGDLYTSCPTLEDHVAAIRNRYGQPTPSDLLREALSMIEELLILTHTPDNNWMDEQNALRDRIEKRYVELNGGK